MKTFHADAEPSGPQRERRRYPCLAHGCPMPGTMFFSGPDAPGICSLHYGSNSSEMARITEVLLNWDCVTFALENARRFLADPACCGDVKAERTLLAAQWKQLQRCAPDWHQQLAPQRQMLGEWARQLLAFLVWRIHCEVLDRPTDWQWPAHQTRTVRDMLSRVRPTSAVRAPDPDESPLSQAEVLIAERAPLWPTLDDERVF